jgi:Golgi nucleoside diphosphatase
LELEFDISHDEVGADLEFGISGFEFLNLPFDFCLEFGIWNSEFGIYNSLLCVQHKQLKCDFSFQKGYRFSANINPVAFAAAKECPAATG